MIDSVYEASLLSLQLTFARFRWHRSSHAILTSWPHPHLSSENIHLTTVLVFLRTQTLFFWQLCPCWYFSPSQSGIAFFWVSIKHHDLPTFIICEWVGLKVVPSPDSDESVIGRAGSYLWSYTRVFTWKVFTGGHDPVWYIFESGNLHKNNQLLTGYNYGCNLSEITPIITRVSENINIDALCQPKSVI